MKDVLPRLKRAPLRLKIALWSALNVAVALLISGVATTAHFYHEDVEMLDHLLHSEVKGVMRELRGIPKPITVDKVKHSLSRAYRQRHLQVRYEERVVFQSERTEKGWFGQDGAGPGDSLVGADGRVRLRVARHGPWEVRMAWATRGLKDSARELVVGFLIASPALLVVTAAGGWWLARQALAPISEVTRAAARITAEHLDQRLPIPPSHDEVRSLSLVLNEMIGNLERSFHQARRFTADTSHELRTPLAVLRAGLESVLESPDCTPAQQEQLLELLDTVTRLSSLMEKLLLLSRADAGRLALEVNDLDLAENLREALDEAEILADDTGVRIRSELPVTLPFQGDPMRLLQVWRNLLSNAVKFNRPAGEVLLRASVEGGTVRVCVENTGAGLSVTDVNRVFERFFRADQARSVPGHGLGLSIAREICRAHGGELRLISAGAERVCFEAVLPVKTEKGSTVKPAVATITGIPGTAVPAGASAQPGRNSV